MTDSGKITQAEMIEIFGETMPIEAVNLLWNSAGKMTIGEMRTKLREIAAARPKDGLPERLLRQERANTDSGWTLVNPEGPAAVAEIERLTAENADLANTAVFWRNKRNEACDEIETLSAQLGRAREALSLFASAIKSGEPWTEECQRVLDNARAALATSSPPSQREVDTAKVAIEMIAGVMRDTAAEIRPDSDMAAEALLGIAESLVERRDKMAADIVARALSVTTKEPR